jgi:hypothetical protein
MTDRPLARKQHNAAQAEYDRSAALGSPEAPEILPGGIMSADAMQRFMDISKFILGHLRLNTDRTRGCGP